MQTCAGSSDGKCVVFGGDSGLHSGKLLGVTANFGDLPESDTSTLNGLGINSERGELDFNGTSFNDPNYDNTVADWINTLTSDHIVPLPLMADYVELSTINVSAFVSATTSWCEAYCAGGSFYSGNSSANPTYAPQVLEILNEPYATYWGYPVTDADVQAYATLLQDIRTDLNNAGLNQK